MVKVFKLHVPIEKNNVGETELQPKTGAFLHKRTDRQACRQAGNLRLQYQCNECYIEAVH
jgi:hypothetical protein